MNPLKYIGGFNIKNAILYMKGSPYTAIYDYAKESSITVNDAFKYMNRIKKDVEEIPRDSTFALKYTSFNNYNYMDYSIKHMLNHVDRIFLDAEHVEVHEKEKDTYAKLIDKYNSDKLVLYKTYQMYRADSTQELIRDMRQYKNLGIKLVRGAYHHKDKNKHIIFSDKLATDDNYNNGIRQVIQEIKTRKEGDIRLLLATHNDESIKLALKISEHVDIGKIEFAQLLGMNDEIGKFLIEKGKRVYKYVPYGGIIETMPYLIRRLYENNDILKHM